MVWFILARSSPICPPAPRTSNQFYWCSMPRGCANKSEVLCGLNFFFEILPLFSELSGRVTRRIGDLVSSNRGGSLLGFLGSQSSEQHTTNIMLKGRCLLRIFWAWLRRLFAVTRMPCPGIPVELAELRTPIEKRDAKQATSTLQIMVHLQDPFWVQMEKPPLEAAGREPLDSTRMTLAKDLA